MHQERIKFVAPVSVVILGVAWLLDSWDVLPGVNWVLTVSPATAGVCILVVGGIDKITLVAGPFLMVVSACRLLSRIGSLAASVEKPIYVIVLGCLLLLVQIPSIPAPGILKPDYWADD